MSNIHLRGLDEPLVYQLKQMASSQHMSVNSLILKVLRQAFGLGEQKNSLMTYHDLDQFAGTWSPKEASIFTDNLSGFEKIDEDLWK